MSSTTVSTRGLSVSVCVCVFCVSVIDTLMTFSAPIGSLQILSQSKRDKPVERDSEITTQTKAPDTLLSLANLDLSKIVHHSVTKSRSVK